jgi:dolichyl-phosphate beta-glucosyltransferase
LLNKGQANPVVAVRPITARREIADNPLRMSNAIVVIPCYNEAARLNAAAFRDFARDHDNIQLLFVDDGSADRTRDLLNEVHQSNPARLLVHALPQNLGKAEAVRQGLLAACERRPTYVGFWDADLATPLSDISNFMQLMDERPKIEMVFGSRVNLLGRNVRRNLARHYIGRVFATAAACALGVGIYDTQCGAKLFRVSDGFTNRLQEPFIGGWIFDVEIIAREVQARRNPDLPQVRSIIYEYPLMEWHDVAGSKIKLRDWFTVGMNLFRIWWKYLRPSATPREHVTAKQQHATADSRR